MERKEGKGDEDTPKNITYLLLSPFQGKMGAVYGVASGRQASRIRYLLVDGVGRVCCQGGSLWHSMGQSSECTLQLCSPGELRKAAKSLIQAGDYGNSQ